MHIANELRKTKTKKIEGCMQNGRKKKKERKKKKGGSVCGGGRMQCYMFRTERVSAESCLAALKVCVGEDAHRVGSKVLVYRYTR